MALLSGAEVYDLMPSYARMVWWRLLPNTDCFQRVTPLEIAASH